MEPHHFFTAQRVLIVAGKGGVGKSAVSGAMALASARSGLRTLMVSLDARTVEVPGNPLLDHVTVTPGRALTDYLSSKGLGLLSRQLARSGIVELVATTAPGLDDLLVLGRIKAFERELRADVIIVDGPAAGHAIDLVRAPIQLKRAISSGPIGQQADEVLTMLADPVRCKVMMVTTAAITPVTETIEAIEDLQTTAHLAFAPVVVNKCDSPPPVVDTQGLDQDVIDGVRYVTDRFVAQQQAIDLLRSKLHIEQIHLPRRRLTGAQLIEAMADEIADNLKGMP